MPKGFNGAAVFQPRKPAETGPAALPVQPASMGPRSFNRGNGSLVLREAIASTLLQWGRGLSTAETASLQVRWSPERVTGFASSE